MTNIKRVSIALCCKLMLGAVPAVAQNVDFDGTNMPCISYNIATAQAAHRPNALTRTTDHHQIDHNRHASCGAARALVAHLNALHGPGTPASCDEYPFASSREGGAGAQIMIVPDYENATQGGVLTDFYGFFGIGDGGHYTVTAVNVPAAGGGHGQLTIVNHHGIPQCHY